MLGIQQLPQMKRPLKLVVTTERCCPTCAYLFEFCKNNADRGFLGAEVSPDWSACSSPSWIPKKAGRYVMERAEDVLQHRLETMVARYREAENSRPEGIDDIHEDARYLTNLTYHSMNNLILHYGLRRMIRKTCLLFNTTKTGSCVANQGSGPRSAGQLQSA